MDMMARLPGRRRAVAALLTAVVAASLCVLLAGGGLARAAPSTAGAAAARTRWGRAEQVPGLAALNKGHNADVTSLSCWAAGSCVAGGFYTDRRRHLQSFVDLERRGRWRTAMEVPGSAALNTGGNAQIGSVSCATNGRCAAVGSYTDSNSGTQWFTVNEQGGRWGTAVQVPYPALNDAVIDTVWCAPGGLCAAGGSFTDPSTGPEAWVQTEVHGSWQPGLEVPGIAAIEVNGGPGGGAVGVFDVACASAGNCAVGGQYSSTGQIQQDYGYPQTQAFVDTETGGTWGTAQEVPGLGPLNGSVDANADTALVTCPSAGDCTAAGYYASGELDDCDPPSAQPAQSGPRQPEPPPFDGCESVFVVNERDGTWSQLKNTQFTGPSALACPAAGDCVVAAFYDRETDSNLPTEGGLISETKDKWGSELGLRRTVTVNSVSCASPGYCAVGGVNLKNSAFVISEWHGTWGEPITPRGIRPAATVSVVACPPKVTLCVAGGSDRGRKGLQAFLVSQTK